MRCCVLDLGGLKLLGKKKKCDGEKRAPLALGVKIFFEGGWPSPSLPPD